MPIETRNYDNIVFNELNLTANQQQFGPRIYWSGSAAPALTATTWAKVPLSVGTLVDSNLASIVSNDFEIGAVAKAGIYTNRRISVCVIVTMASSSANRVIDINFAKNDVLDSFMEQSRKVSTSGDQGNASVCGQIVVTDDDLISLWVRSDGNTTLTLSNIVIQIDGIISDEG